MQDERPGAGLRMHQVCLSIVVPERTRVFQSRPCNHLCWSAPWSAHLRRGADKDSFGRRGEVNVEQTVMFTNGRRPDAFAVAIATYHAVARIHLHALHDVPDDRPMNKVARLQDRNAGDKMKCRCD